MNAEGVKRPPPRQPQRRLSEWFAPAKRSAGGWAFWLHRITGVVLVFYLLLHLSVLGYLARGPAAYHAVLRLFAHPFFVALEVALMAAIAFHGLNGLRLVLMGLNLGVRHHKAMFWAALALSALATLWAAGLMFSGGVR